MNALKLGRYRNHLGAEIEITGTLHSRTGTQHIGRIYAGEQHDDLFGTSLFAVTAEGMEEAGYKFLGDSQ